MTLKGTSKYFPIQMRASTRQKTKRTLHLQSLTSGMCGPSSILKTKGIFFTIFPIYYLETHCTFISYTFDSSVNKNICINAVDAPGGHTEEIWRIDRIIHKQVNVERIPNDNEGERRKEEGKKESEERGEKQAEKENENSQEMKRSVWNWEEHEMEIIGRDSFECSTGQPLWPSDHYGLFASFVLSEHKPEE